MSTIEDAIGQTAFASPAHRLRVNILYTADWLRDRIAETIEPLGLTQPQFNALRILRGRKRQEDASADPAALGSFSTSDLRERLVTRASDTPRLVERLVAQGWVHKQPCPHDARRVHLSILPAGLALLGRIDDAALDALTAGLTDTQADRLSDLLDTLRS